MTLFKLSRAGLLSAAVLAGLAGCGDKDEDTAADDSTATDDSTADDSTADDSSADDTGSTSYFEAVAFFQTIRSGFDGVGLAGYSGVDTNGSPFTQETPWAEITFVTQEYLDTGDDRYSCILYVDLEEIGVDTLQSDAIWWGWEVAYTASTLDDGSIATNCANFDPNVWGEDTPITVVESTRWAFGLGPLSSDTLASLETAVGNAGLDWEADWAPFVFGGYTGFPDESGNLAGDDSNFCFGYELDETGGIVYGGDDQPVSRELGGADGLSDPTLAICSGYGGWYTFAITGE